MLQGSGRRISAAIFMATCARERPCLWWKLPGSRTTLEDAQRNGSTLDIRLRHRLGHVFGPVLPQESVQKFPAASGVDAGCLCL